ncbi:hypothetical protein QMP26_04290 [Enterocloster clostridioformis]
MNKPKSTQSFGLWWRRTWEDFTKGKLKEHYQEKFNQSIWEKAKAQAPDIPEVEGTGIKNIKSYRR